MIELSKPVGIHPEVREFIVTGINDATTHDSVDQCDYLFAANLEKLLQPLYSQEYVSALTQRIAELEAKLATPVRLPDVRQSSSGDRYQWSDGAHNYRLDVISMLLSAGFTVAVAGDE